MNQQQTIIKVISFTEVPDKYTGIAIRSNGSKCWFKEGKRHRIDGPANEYFDGSKIWWIEGILYGHRLLKNLIEFSIFLGTEKGKYDLDWLRFLTEEEGIQEFPIVPGMEELKTFQELFKSLRNQIVGATIP